MRRQARQGKLGISFHRTFPLSRAAITQVLRVLAKHDGTGAATDIRVSRQEIRDSTSLGTVYVEAMPRYARGCGLTGESGSLTALGRQVMEYDETLSRTSTQWLMHYHLCAPHHCGPQFWTGCVLRSLRAGEVLSRASLVADIAGYLSEEGESTPSDALLGQAATAFLGTYAKEEGLGALRVLEGRSGGEYAVGEPTEPDVSVFGYAVADYWDRAWPGVRTVNLDAITSERGAPASLLLLGSGQANRLLREMQAHGWVEIQRRAAPYQVVRLWDDSAAFLERIYAEPVRE